MTPTPRWYTALETLVCVLGVIVIGFPEARTGRVHLAFVCVTLPYAVIGLRQLWKDGYLRMTPGQVYGQMRVVGPARKRTPLALPAAVITMTAIWKVLF